MSSNLVSADVYRDLCELLETRSGLVLGKQKEYLLTTRLTPVLREYGLCSLEELIKRLANSMETRLYQRIIDAMTTKETSWFRDETPFEILSRHLLPLYARQDIKQLRIWSAACATGQEPYSISMIHQEYISTYPGRLAPVQILATDIAANALAHAKQGFYDDLAINRGLSEPRRRRFFTRQENGWGVIPAVRNAVSFRQFNLLDSYVLLGKFDLIYCRNVLIYFSAAVKADILRRMAATLKPGGYLFLGSSESLGEAKAYLETVTTPYGIVYRRL
jgi:chemotaxis protein methyltransferase CheR